MRSHTHCRRCGHGLKQAHDDRCPLRYENADGTSKRKRAQTPLGVVWRDMNVVTGGDCGPANPNDRRDAHLPAPEFSRATL